LSLTADLNEDTEAVGARIRTALGITLSNQTKWRDYYTAFNAWRSAVEGKGILVFQFSRINSDLMRGFSVAETVVPVVGLNRGEAPQARSFSLLHEFTHLLLRISGVCDFGEDNRPPEEQRVEIFCNAAAAAALVPISSLRAEPLIAAHPNRPREWEDEIVSSIGARYKVSREVTVRRLVTAGLATREFYARKRAQYLAEQRRRKEQEADKAVPEKGGRRAAARLGLPYGRLVLSSYYQDLITLSDVTNYLGMKLSYLPDFESAMGMS
jgi:Zn-dependent peptidase ImmA (M78 family)